MSTDRQKSRRAKKRTYNTRLIKRDYSYFIWEIAELFDLHPNAVRRWLKAGLITLDARRPILIHGGDLMDFLDMRQASRKQKCATDELFCLRCRRPRHPRFGRVELRLRGEMRLDLSGVCEACGTRMHRAGSAARLEEYREAFRIEMPGERRITGCSEPSLMCHLSEEKLDAAI
jgi:hypothetical protein